MNVRGHHGFEAGPGDHETTSDSRRTHADFGMCSSFGDGVGASAGPPARVRRDDAGVSSASPIVKPLLALPAALWRRILPISSAVLPSPAMRRGVARGERADAVGRGKGRKAWRPDLTAAATALPSAAPGNPEKGSVLPKAID